MIKRKLLRDTMSEAIKNVTDADFGSDVLESDLPVLVDFWAPWCGPCKMMGPILDDLQQTFALRMSIVKLNVDEHPQIPAKYGVRGIPALMIFKNGELAATHVGLISKGDLATLIEENIA